MGKLIKALKNLGSKINGNEPDGKYVSEVIDNVANDFENGTTATKEYVNSLMSGALKRAIVEALPEEDIDTNTIYMVLDSEASSGNVYNEYLYIEEAWELIGTTEMVTNHLYRHRILEKNANSMILELIIIDTNPNAYTEQTMLEWLGNNSSSENPYEANGVFRNGGIDYQILGVYKANNPLYPFGIEYIKDINTLETSGFATFTNFTDTVVQIF